MAEAVAKACSRKERPHTLGSTVEAIDAAILILEIKRLCRKVGFWRPNPKIGPRKINHLRVPAFLFSVICDRAQTCPQPARPGTPPRRPGRGTTRAASGRAPYGIVHSPCRLTHDGGGWLTTRERSRRLDDEHTQLIASKRPGPQGRGGTGVAQVFPEGPPLRLVQVRWHQGEEGL